MTFRHYSSKIQEEEIWGEKDKDFLEKVSVNRDDVTASMVIHQMLNDLYYYYGKRQVIEIRRRNRLVKHLYYS